MFIRIVLYYIFPGLLEEVKFEKKKNRHFKKLAIDKKNPHFSPIQMKLGKNNFLMSISFSQSFMRIGQKMWIFTIG